MESEVTSDIPTKHVSFQLSSEKQDSNLTKTIDPEPPKTDNNSFPDKINDNLKTEPSENQPSEIDKLSLRSSRYKKGLNAKFIRQNPRFINDPICHVLPNESSSSVHDCLHWSQESEGAKRIM